jgi:hypothetical protein
LDHVQPGPRHKSTTKTLAYDKRPNLKVVLALQDWHQKALIDDKHLRSLMYPLRRSSRQARHSPCTEEAVKGYLLQQWVFWTMYGSNITAVTMSSQPPREITLAPSPAASVHRHKNRDVGPGAVHGSGDALYATRNLKRGRSSSPTDLSTEQGPKQQKRTRRAAANMPIHPPSHNVTASGVSFLITIPTIVPPVLATCLCCVQQ